MSNYQIVSVPSSATGQVISTSTTSAQSAALEDADYMLVCTALTFIRRGSSPTATTSCLPIAPNVPYTLRGVKQGEKLAFILAASTGSAYLAKIS